MPKFTHDCDGCRFIATVAAYDLYTCPAPEGDTYIARFSSDGPDYASRCDWQNEVRTEVQREFPLASEQLILTATTYRMIRGLKTACEEARLPTCEACMADPIQVLCPEHSLVKYLSDIEDDNLVWGDAK